MPSFAEMIGENAFQTARNVGNGVPEAITSASELALRKEQLQQSKQKLEMEKQQLQNAKWEKLADDYTTYGKTPDGPGKKFLGEKVIPARLRMMGLDQSMNPAVMDQMTRDPELGNFLASRAAQGQVTNADIANAVKDPMVFNKMISGLGYGTWVDEKFIKGTAEAVAPAVASAEDKALQRKTQLQAATSRGNAFQDRNVIGVIKDATDAVTTKNKVIKDLVVSSNNISNSITAFYEGGAKPQDYYEMQQTVRSNLGIKGSSGVHERAATIAKDWGVPVDEVIQFLTGEPQSVMESSPKLAQAVIRQARAEMQNKRAQAESEQNTQMQKNEAYFKMYPQLRDSVEASRKELGNQFSQPRTPGSGTVTVDGVTYDRIKAKALAEANLKSADPNIAIKAKKILDALKAGE